MNHEGMEISLIRRLSDAKKKAGKQKFRTVLIIGFRQNALVFHDARSLAVVDPAKIIFRKKRIDFSVKPDQDHRFFVNPRMVVNDGPEFVVTGKEILRKYVQVLFRGGFGITRKKPLIETGWVKFHGSLTVLNGINAPLPVSEPRSIGGFPFLEIEKTGVSTFEYARKFVVKNAFDMTIGKVRIVFFIAQIDRFTGMGSAECDTIKTHRTKGIDPFKVFTDHAIGIFLESFTQDSDHPQPLKP
jgi:hypothetical protein